MDDAKVASFNGSLEGALLWLHDYLLEEYLNANQDVLPISKNLSKYESFYEEIRGLLSTIYLYWQGEWLAVVVQETKELQALAALDFDLSFDIAPDRATDYSQTRTGELIKWIDTYTQQEVQKIVRSSLAEGWTQQKLTQEIYSQFSQFSARRSKLIARQETALALSGGKYNQFLENAKAFNTVGWKRAHTQQDGKVREDHLDNQRAWRIPANEPFPGTLNMHDPFGYNCRCVTELRLFLPNELGL